MNSSAFTASAFLVSGRTACARPILFLLHLETTPELPRNLSKPPEKSSRRRERRFGWRMVEGQDAVSEWLMNSLVPAEGIYIAALRHSGTLTDRAQEGHRKTGRIGLARRGTMDDQDRRGEIEQPEGKKRTHVLLFYLVLIFIIVFFYTAWTILRESLHP
jgi:hypothetical protein